MLKIPLILPLRLILVNGFKTKSIFNLATQQPVNPATRKAANIHHHRSTAGSASAGAILDGLGEATGVARCHRRLLVLLKTSRVDEP